MQKIAKHLPTFSSGKRRKDYCYRASQCGKVLEQYFGEEEKRENSEKTSVKNKENASTTRDELFSTKNKICRLIYFSFSLQ